MENLGVQIGTAIERNLQNKSLIEASKKAEHAAMVKSEFLSNMSHELRTPMHAILNYATMGLKSHNLSEKEKLEKYLINIQLAGTRLLKLLNNLLDLAKMDSGKMKFSLIQGNFIEVLEHAKIELYSLLREKNLEIEISSTTEHTEIMFDQQRMIQVLVNLISNAIKFSPENSIITIKVMEACLPSGLDALSCSVINHGNTIPDNELESIFNKFVQSSKTKTGAGGTGLGLAISKEIIEGHGGKIWAENGITGTVIFSFLIPKQAREDKTL